MKQRQRGFINLAIAILLLVATLLGVWGVEYIRRINEDKKFKQRVDQLTISAASFQSMTMNGVTLLNDGIIADDTAATVVAVVSVVVGVVTIIAGGAGLEIIKDGLRISKKIIKVGNKVEKLQKRWTSLGPIFTYLPYLLFYSQKLKELKESKMIFLPIPFIPDLSTGEESGSGERSQYDLKIHVSWSLDEAVKGVVKQLIHMADDKIGTIEKKAARRFDNKIDGRIASPFCHKFASALFPTAKHPYEKCKKWVVGKIGSSSPFYKSVQRLFDANWNSVKGQMLSSVDSLNLKGEKIFGLKVPVPAAISDNFYRIQKIGTLAIWENRGFAPIKWLTSNNNTINIPVEIQFSRAIPYSDVIDGGVPMVPDWKGIFVPPDLLAALGVKGD